MISRKPQISLIVLTLLLALGSACEDVHGDCGLGSCYGPGPLTQLAIWNGSDHTQELSVRILRQNIQLDCGALADVPASPFFDRDMFQEGEEWVLSPGSEDGVRFVTERDCNVVLIESAVLPNILVFVPKDAPERGINFFNRGEVGENSLMILSNQSPADAVFSWETNGEHPLFQEFPAEEPGIPSEACQMPAPGVSISWDLPSEQEHAPMEIVEGQDGCHQLIFESGAPWTVCAPLHMVLPLRELGPLDPSTVPEHTCNMENDGFCLITQTDEHSISIRVRGLETYELTLARGFREIVVGSETAEDLVRSECAPLPDVCDVVALPARLRIGNELIGLGGFLELRSEQGVSELYLARAARLPALDPACGAVDVFGRHTYMEWARSTRMR